MKDCLLIENMNVVMDGRDIGTIIMPNANLKIYLTASITERARRRTKELKELGKKVSFYKIWLDIYKRDYVDKHRKIAPLKKAKDAILIKTNKKYWLNSQYFKYKNSYCIFLSIMYVAASLSQTTITSVW